MKKKLILFDVDGTLITYCSLHREAFSEGFKSGFGVDISTNELKMHGMTDRGIVLKIAEMYDIPKEQVLKNIDQIFEIMKKHFMDNISNDDTFHIINGVLPLLSELEKRGHVLGLLTGNLEAIAEAKMKNWDYCISLKSVHLDM